MGKDLKSSETLVARPNWRIGEKEERRKVSVAI